MSQVVSTITTVLKTVWHFVLFVARKIKAAVVIVGKGFVEVIVDFYTPVRKPAPPSPTQKRPKKIKVIVERHASPDMVSFHLDRRLTNGRIVRLSQRGGSIAVEPAYGPDKDEPVSEYVLQLAAKIAAIDGIDAGEYMSGLRVSQYEIHVRKAKAFDDKEIEDKVLCVIAASFGIKIEDLDISIRSERHLLGYYRRMESRQPFYDYESEYQPPLILDYDPV